MKKLLIVVDMLNDFCHEDGLLSKSMDNDSLYAELIIDNIANRVEVYRADEYPIIWLCENHSKDDKEFDRFPPHGITNTWGVEIIAQYNPLHIKSSTTEMIIPKTRYSGFYGTNLEYQLSRLAPEEVEVAGVCTSICVMDTVGGLANRDYSIIVYSNCVADFNIINHEYALTRMDQLYGAKII